MPMVKIENRPGVISGKQLTATVVGHGGSQTISDGDPVRQRRRVTAHVWPMFTIPGRDKIVQVEVDVTIPTQVPTDGEWPRSHPPEPLSEDDFPDLAGLREVAREVAARQRTSYARALPHVIDEIHHTIRCEAGDSDGWGKSAIGQLRRDSEAAAFERSKPAEPVEPDAASELETSARECERNADRHDEAWEFDAAKALRMIAKRNRKLASEIRNS